MTWRFRSRRVAGPEPMAASSSAVQKVSHPRPRRRARDDVVEIRSPAASNSTSRSESPAASIPRGDVGEGVFLGVEDAREERRRWAAPPSRTRRRREARVEVREFSRRRADHVAIVASPSRRLRILRIRIDATVRVARTSFRSRDPRHSLGDFRRLVLGGFGSAGSIVVPERVGDEAGTIHPGGPRRSRAWFFPSLGAPRASSRLCTVVAGRRIRGTRPGRV